MFERDACAERDTIKSIFGKYRFDAGAAKHQFGKISKLRRTAGHGDTLVDNVRSKLRRGLLKNVLYCLYHFPKFFGNRFDDFIGFNFGGSRQSGDEVPSLDCQSELLLKRYG